MRIPGRTLIEHLRQLDRRALAASVVGALILIGGVWTGIVVIRDTTSNTVDIFRGALDSPASGGAVETAGGWWPPRDGFSYYPCAKSNGICGSSTGPVFNSFISTPSYGDERAFFDGRRSDQPLFSDPVRDVSQGSRLVVLRVYVHNNADIETNATGVGIAHGARVRVELPTVAGSSLQAVAWIEADNAVPTGVEDTVQLRSNAPFRVSFVSGSAVQLRGNIKLPLSDDIVTPAGALVGVMTPNGRLPGGFDTALVVQLSVRVQPVTGMERSSPS